ncbi:MAG: GntR family hexuronate regulon transcriptional repressor [Oceanicoccus sp.]
MTTGRPIYILAIQLTFWLAYQAAMALLMTSDKLPPKRLYQQVADQLSARIESGEFSIGERFPAERKLATLLKVSRATIREAMIALELAGMVEIRTGSGIFVIAENSTASSVGIHDIGPGPFELIEARTLFESEAAAIAATRISEQELQELDSVCKQMSSLMESGQTAEDIDHRFHQLIAEATRNSAIVSTIDQMWEYRTRMPMWGKLHDLISERAGEPDWTLDPHTIVDHRRILNALRARDANAARDAMRLHLDHVKDALLKASELDAIDLSDFNPPNHKSVKK